MSDRDLEVMFELDDAPGPARPIDDKRAAAIVAAAVGGAGFGPPSGGGAAAPAKLGKLLLLVGGAAGIALVAWLATRGPDAPPPAAPPAAPIAAVAPPVVVEPPPPPVVAEPPPPPPPPPVVAPAKPIVRAAPKPEDLLAEANGERTSHRWKEADALYARVVALPHAPRLAVQTALVASASLHLEHLGDASGATRRFRAALAAGPDGALAEDARWGLAEAARGTAAERAALDDFLAHHADSPLAPQARTRRAAL